MKATLLNNEVGPNPAYNRQAQRAAKASGKPYTIPKWLLYHAGTVRDDPDAWMLCVLNPPKARPADDECLERVAKWFQGPTRIARLRDLKAMASEPVFSTLPEEVRLFVRDLKAKWDGELRTVEPTPPAPPDPFDLSDDDDDE